MNVFKGAQTQKEYININGKFFMLKPVRPFEELHPTGKCLTIEKVCEEKKRKERLKVLQNDVNQLQEDIRGITSKATERERMFRSFLQHGVVGEHMDRFHKSYTPQNRKKIKMKKQTQKALKLLVWDTWKEIVKGYSDE